MIDTEVTWNVPNIEKKLDSLVDDDLMTKVHQLYAEIVDPWTPYLTGKLHRTFMVDAEKVTYLVPYAAKKYYGEVYTKTVHPLATSHWDKVAMQTEMPLFEQKVKELLKEKAREIYG